MRKKPGMMQQSTVAEIFQQMEETNRKLWQWQREFDCQFCNSRCHNETDCVRLVPLPDERPFPPGIEEFMTMREVRNLDNSSVWQLIDIYGLDKAAGWSEAKRKGASHQESLNLLTDFLCVRRAC